MTIDARDFVRVMRLGALQAGAVARHLRGRVGAVTAADRAAQDVSLHLLRDAFSDLAVDAEGGRGRGRAVRAGRARPRGSDDYAVTASTAQR